MADLIERLAKVHPTRPGIALHLFDSLLAEWARGNATGAQANTIVTAVTGVGFNAAEQTEAQAIVNSVPTGSTTANQAARALKLIEIMQVLMLAETSVPLALAPLDTPASVRTRLGI